MSFHTMISIMNLQFTPRKIKSFGFVFKFEPQNNKSNIYYVYVPKVVIGLLSQGVPWACAPMPLQWQCLKNNYYVRLI